MRVKAQEDMIVVSYGLRERLIGAGVLVAAAVGALFLWRHREALDDLEEVRRMYWSLLSVGFVAGAYLVSSDRNCLFHRGSSTCIIRRRHFGVFPTKRSQAFAAICVVENTRPSGLRQSRVMITDRLESADDDPLQSRQSGHRCTVAEFTEGDHADALALQIARLTNVRAIGWQGNVIHAASDPRRHSHA